MPLTRAKREKRRLILYDWDAPSLFGEPAADLVVERRLGPPLPRPPRPPEQLDAAGQSAIAEQVRALRRDGVDAFAWLPSDHGPGALAEYANGRMQT